MKTVHMRKERRNVEGGKESDESGYRRDGE